MRAKAVLCPGLHVSFHDEQTGETEEWHYENGLPNYLLESIGNAEHLPDEPFVGSFNGNKEMVDWAAVWLPEKGNSLQKVMSISSPPRKAAPMLMVFV